MTDPSGLDVSELLELPPWRSFSNPGLNCPAGDLYWLSAPQTQGHTINHRFQRLFSLPGCKPSGHDILDNDAFATFFLLHIHYLLKIAFHFHLRLSVHRLARTGPPFPPLVRVVGAARRRLQLLLVRRFVGKTSAIGPC